MVQVLLSTCRMSRSRCGLASWLSTGRDFLKGNIMGLRDKNSTLQGTNISHLGKRKIIFKYALSGGYVNFLEGIYVSRCRNWTSCSCICCNDIQLLSCFLAPSGFLLNAMGTCCLKTGFCAGNLYFFCGLWWFLLHSAIAFTMIFFLQGNLFNEKNVPAMFFSVEGKHGCKITISNLWTAWGCAMNGSFQSTLGVEAFEHGNPQVSDKNPPKILRKQVGGLIFFLIFPTKQFGGVDFLYKEAEDGFAIFPRVSLISSYHTEMELKKSKFPETSGIYDKTYGCLDIGFVVVWGRMDSKASTQNAIVENEDS